MKRFLFILTFGFAVAVSACGPFFPPSYLAEESPFKMESRLRYNLILLGKQFFPEAWIWNVPQTPGLSTTEGTRQDFLAAGNPENELAKYLKFDAACREGKLPSMDQKKLPAAQREFYLYSAGYAQMRQDANNTFPEAWQELLALPKSERKYRSTWVHYMLGNLALKKSADEAFAHYNHLRLAVAEEGFADSLNLFSASYRVNAEQANNPFDRLRYSVVSARFFPVWEKAFYRQVDEVKKLDLNRMRHDPLLREILLLTAGNPLQELEQIPDNRTLLSTERVAARCYFENRLKECKALLAYLPEDSLIRLYLKARFEMRDGETEKAAATLSQWLELYRKSAEKKNPAIFREYLFSDQIFTREITFEQEVDGLLGTVLVEQSDFLRALQAFLGAGSWNDAAIVAEQLLSTNTLVEFCENHATDTEKPINRALRYLLARRLMREFRVDEAGKYFPSDNKPLYELYRAASVRANDIALSADERALALFQLGRLLLRKGDELRGTELEPDNFIVRGQHEELPSQKWRDGQYPIDFDYSKMYDNPRLTGLRMWAVPFPDYNRITRRFHYRRNAADCFARAGVLTTDQNVRSAAFWAAGAAIMLRHPDEANEYYLMLCDSVDAPLAAEARKRNWFPPALKLNDYIRNAPLEHAPEAKDFPPLFKGESNE